MKSLIIYRSVHKGNTEKIAKVIAEELISDIVSVSELNNFDVSSYDLIGFGSGIYMANFNGFVISVIDKLQGFNGKKVFIFSTSGSPKSFFNSFDKRIKKKIKENNGILVGEFNCQGFDAFGPFKLVGGINKGRPNDLDIENTRKFARKLKEAN
ncbi:MAG: flavodoxin family protein [Candidatus Paceibacterota bacterium]|jgi:flavodoxin|nr:flavodoxin family protein [bacterium]